jgi:hypothetical protein
MDVIICAAGLGSRLANYTHDVIPKYLVNIDDNTGLFHIIKYWSKYSENIYLIIHSKFINLTEFYIKSIFDDEHYNKIKIINYDSFDGTAYTLNFVINNKLPQTLSNNFVITWCDLYPKEPLYQSRFTKPGIYIYTHGNSCRYLFNDINAIDDIYRYNDKCNNDQYNKIINRDSECDGNILGIYYFHNIKSFKIDNSNALNKDIVVFLKDLGELFNYKVESIIDYGDENKLDGLYKIYYPDSLNLSDSSKLQCRYFNQLTILDTEPEKNDPPKIFKKGITDKGKELIKNECEWFKRVPYQIFLPRIFNFYEHGYIMEYMKTHIPLYKFLKSPSLPENYNKILKTIFSNLNTLHKLEKIKVSELMFFNNIKIEIFDKLYSRKKAISPLLDYFGNIKIVNSVEIMSFDDVFAKCKNIIIQYYKAIEKYEYSIIMGDCQFSNILIDPCEINNIIFIDPRGYFGTSKVHGPIEYDYAKVLYAISGYDDFNIGKFNVKKIDIENGILDFDIRPITSFDERLIKYYFNKVHRAFMVIIWLSLAEYNKNDIWKCLCSYYHGLYLGTQL